MIFLAFTSGSTTCFISHDTTWKGFGETLAARRVEADIASNVHGTKGDTTSNLIYTKKKAPKRKAKSYKEVRKGKRGE